MVRIKTPKYENFAELLENIGDVPPERIRMIPPPGTATEKDVLAAELLPRKRLCELVDGVLIEKVMGIKESLLAGLILTRFNVYLKQHKLGFALGADGAVRLLPGVVRIPDVCFVSWDQFPDRMLPGKPLPDLAPDLAVEVVSESNTTGEIARKLKDYFLSGVRLVWLIYPKTQTAEVYTDPGTKTSVRKNGALDGGAVFPGFRLSLKQVFDDLPASKAV